MLNCCFYFISNAKYTIKKELNKNRKKSRKNVLFLPKNIVRTRREKEYFIQPERVSVLD